MYFRNDLNPLWILVLNLDLPRSSDPKMSRFFHAYLAVLEGRAFINMLSKGLAHLMNVWGVKKGNDEIFECPGFNSSANTTIDR